MVLAPVVRERKGEYGKLLEEMRQQGYARAVIDGDLRRLDEEIVLDKRYKHDIAIVIDRLVMKEGLRKRLAESIEAAAGLADGLVEVEIVDSEGAIAVAGAQTLSGPSAGKRGEVLVFSEKFACLNCGTSMPEIEPRIFSFNSPHGACERCHGLGFQRVIDPELCIPDPTLSISEGALATWMGAASMYYRRLVEAVCEDRGIDIEVPWQDLPGCRPQGPARGNRQRAPSDHLQEPVRAAAQLQRPLRGDHDRARAALREHRLGEDPRADRGPDGPAALPGLRGRPAAAGEPRGDRRRALDRRVLAALGASGPGVDRLARADRDRAGDRQARRPRGRGAADLPGLGRDRLSDPRAGGDYALRRRGAANPAGHSDRLQPRRCPLHPRRAVDRPAPARQREADRDAGAAPRPRQHRDRRRARRGDDARRRLPRRSRTRARASTAGGSSPPGLRRR